MIVGIGVDIVEISRIKKSILDFGETFLNRVFTKNEIKYCSNKSNPYQHYAARFASKEAIIKASNKKIVQFLQIEIENDESGKPEVHLSDPNFKILLSISHSNDNAIAFALCLTNEESNEKLF